jgi:hypothetical protein
MPWTKGLEELPMHRRTEEAQLQQNDGEAQNPRRPNENRDRKVSGLERCFKN